MSFKLTWKSQLVSSFIAIGIVLIMYSSIESIMTNYIQLFMLRDNFIVNSISSIFLLMVPITIVHEAIHGAAYKLFGGKVRFGFKFIYAYTQEISEKPLLRVEFLIVLLSPLIVISLISLILPVWIGGMVFMLNLLGASGDIYMALFLCKFNYESKIIDKNYGFDVIE